MTISPSSSIRAIEELPKAAVTLKVAFVGANAVGKTSTLTVMYRFFKDPVVKTDLDIIIDAESLAIIQKHEQELENLVQSFDATDRGLQGTQDWTSIKLTLIRKRWRSRDALGLEFLDFPGGWINNKDDDNYKKYLKEVAESGAIIIPVDSLALMKGNGRFHQEINKPEQVTEFIQTAYQQLSLSEKRLVIFVPIKCESFVRNDKDTKEFPEAVRNGYRNLINNVLIPKASNVAAVIAPVQTVGCVICGGWEDGEQGKFKKWYLEKTSVDALMNPQWEDQPLRYILRFLINQYIERRQRGPFGAINNFLGANNDLKEALASFARGRVLTPPFEIIQGHDLLDI